MKDKTMKKVLISLLSLLLCAALLGCGKNKDTDVPAGMQLASSEDADYLFYVPESWRVDKSTLYSAAYYSSGDATSISVTAYGMDFTEVTVADWWEGFAEKFSATFETMEVTATEDATLGGVDAVKYSFDATLAGGGVSLYRGGCHAQQLCILRHLHLHAGVL